MPNICDPTRLTPLGLEELQNVFELVQAGIWVADQGGLCVLINRKACEILGYRREECLGENLHLKMQADVARGPSGSSSRLQHGVFWRADGTWFAAEYSSQPIRLDPGNTGTVITLVDISQRLAAEAILRRSDERYRAAFNNALIGMAVADLEGRFLEVNQSLSVITGYSEQELLAMDVLTITPREEWPILAEVQRSMLAGETSKQIVTKRYIRRDLQQVWVRSSISLARDEKGHPSVFVSLIEDITESRRTEAKLRETEQRFTLLTEAIDEVFWLSEVKSRKMIYISPAYERIWGRPAESLYQNPCSFIESVEPQDRERMQFFMDNTFVQGEPFDLEYWIRRPNGELACIWSRGFPVRNGEGELEFYVGIAIDITLRKKMQEAIRTHADELSRSNAELERFAYVASHDLQEPLRMVSSYTQLLYKRYSGQLDDKAERYIHYAVDGAKRMQQLITDLLAYSQVNSAAQDLRLIDVQAALEGTLNNLKQMVDDSGATVTWDRLPQIQADASQMDQLFQNLIGNALKFRSELPPKVHISALDNGDTWLFSIADNGIGIEPHHTERIFEVFHRLHSRSEYPGTGIGLAIAKRVVERHGGRMWVESEPGRGSTFRFILPKQPMNRDYERV